jgi:molecular chaperone DnaJ
MRTCDKCGGSGKKVINPCPHCNGNGLEDKFNQIDIDIPKGSFEGVQYVINEQGNAPLHNDGIYGDLIIVISEEPHETFIRDGANLIVEIEIPVIDAILGCITEVPTLDGKILSTKIRNGIEDGERVRFKGKGLPTPNGQVGDMIGIIKLKIPKSITDAEKDVLQQLKESKNFQ